MLPKHVSAQSWAGICDRVLAGAAASGLQWSITNRAAHTAPGAERIWIVDDVSLDRAKHKPRAERDSAGAEGRRAKDKSTERTNSTWPSLAKQVPQSPFPARLLSLGSMQHRSITIPHPITVSRHRSRQVLSIKLPTNG